MDFEIAAEWSSTGLAAIIDGTAQIGMSSREAKATKVSAGACDGGRKVRAPAGRRPARGEGYPHDQTAVAVLAAGSTMAWRASRKWWSRLGSLRAPWRLS